jgi:hypothetical protein
VQPEDAQVLVEIKEEPQEVADDDDYCGYYGGEWVDTDTEEEPMELLEDHPAIESGDDSDQGAIGGDGVDPGAPGDDTRDGGDGQAAPDGGGDDPKDR